MINSDPSGKVVWLTGAAGGLGVGIARRLAEEGYKLALHYLSNRSRAEKLQADLAESGYKTTLTKGDLSVPGIASDVYKSIVKELGIPYGLVHLAGPYVGKKIIDHSRKEFDEMVSGNLTSYFEAIKAVVPAMQENKLGRIIGTGMIGAHQTTPMRFTGPHLAAKSAVVALSRTLAIEEAVNGITVNVINPGHILHKELNREEARAKKAGETHPMGVHGSWEDLADAIIYLLSPGASYVTGAVLEVTGGWMGEDYVYDTQ